MRIVYGLIAASVSVGCYGTQEGRIYRMKDGRSAAVMVHTPSERAGDLEAVLPSGETCRGTFGEKPVASSNGERSEEEGVDPLHSRAILVCPVDRVLRCTLLRGNDRSSFTVGECKDDNGGEYSMLF